MGGAYLQSPAWAIWISHLDFATRLGLVSGLDSRGQVVCWVECWGAIIRKGYEILAELVATLMAAKAGRCLGLRRFALMMMFIARS
jgi:hypothetical protein